MTYQITTSQYLGTWTIQEIIDCLQQYSDITVIDYDSDDINDVCFTIETHIHPTELNGEVVYSITDVDGEFTIYHKQ